MGRTVIGVDLGGTNLRTALLSAEGEVLDRYREPTHASEGWQKVVDRLIRDHRACSGKCADNAA